MVSSRVGPDGGSALLTALARGNGLRDLDLSDNPITAGFASSLQGMLTSQSQLTRLVFNDTCLQVRLPVVAVCLPWSAGQLFCLQCTRCSGQWH